MVFIVDLIWKKKSYYNMLYLVLLLGLAYLENYTIVWTSWWRTISSVEDNGLCTISFHYLKIFCLSSKLLCIFYMMFLDALVIVLSVYEYFVFKMIYFSIYFSHIGLEVRLDYDSINTILLLFSEKFLYFFPLWNCTLLFF